MIDKQPVICILLEKEGNGGKGEIQLFTSDDSVI